MDKSFANLSRKRYWGANILKSERRILILKYANEFENLMGWIVFLRDY